MSNRVCTKNVTQTLTGGVIDMRDDCQLLGVTKNRMWKCCVRLLTDADARSGGLTNMIT